MNRLTVLAVAIAMSLGTTGARADQNDGFVPLFNGKDLTGWVNVNCAPETWSVADGMIHCTGKPICELRTERMYENFVLELEWMHTVPKQNAGVFIWGDAITARGQPFVRAVEIQVLDGNHGDIFPIHGARMTPDPASPNRGDRSLPRERRSRPAGAWNHYRITAQNGTIKLEVNGGEVAGGSDISPRKGYIHLESEGGVVNWRNIRIRELPASGTLPAEDVATADEGFVSLYTGTDFRGWQFPAGHEGHWASNDWRIEYDGQSAATDKNLTSEREFGDVTVIADWRQAASPDAVLPIGIEGMTLPAGTQALVTKALAAATAPRGGGGGGGRGGGQPAAGRGGQTGEGRAGGAPPQAAAEGARQGGQPAAQGAEGQRGRGQAAGGRRGGGGGGQARPWVRGMLTRQKGRVSLTINGQMVFENVPVKSASPRGRVVLRHQDRPIEFASIFVKTLD
jgi:hypothetical protein